MRKNFLIFIIVVISSLFTRASEKYVLRNGNGPSYTVLIDECLFEITITTWERHQGYTVILSSGFVFDYNDTLVLHDPFNKTSFRAIRLPMKSLSFIDGFKSLYGKNLDYIGGSPSYVTMRDIFDNKNFSLTRISHLDSLLYAIGTAKLGNVQHVHFEEGLYSQAYPLKNDSPLDQNVIIKRGRYQYRFDKEILSEGTLSVLGNYLIFKDETLNAYLIAKINDDASFTTITFPSQQQITLKLINQ